MHRIHFKNRSLDILGRPLIMGIHNSTPDSFSDGAPGLTAEQSIRHCLEMIDSGADIIDIGGESTRPGSTTKVSVAQELARVIPVISELRRIRPSSVISIDTMKPEVAMEAVNAGADIINDVSGLKYSEQTARIAAETGAGLIIMHMKSDPHSQCADCIYDGDPADEIKAFLLAAAEKAVSLGVSRNKIIIDPGLGGGCFGKSDEQNLEIISRIEEFRDSGYPVLLGASRKGFLGKLINEPVPSGRLSASLAVAAFAAMKQVEIIRVHDVRETYQLLQVLKSFLGY